MNGIVGFTINDLSGTESVHHLEMMQDSINHLPTIYKKEPIFIDKWLGVTGVNKIKSLVNKEPEKGNVLVWIKGNIYYKNKYHSNFDVSTPESEILKLLYKKNSNWKFLRDIDGVFSAVVYDKSEHTIHFITDRHGLGYLYLYQNNHHLAWASESKAFLELPWFSPTIREEGVHEFLKYGYQIGNKTWLEGVKLLPPASVTTYDLKTFNKSFKNYWDWNDIKNMRLEECSDEQEIAEELGRRFVQSVEERSSTSFKALLGVTLSGGLDSRAIVASIPKRYEPFYALSFGKEKADDIKIAKKIVRLRNIKHDIYNLSKNNWFYPRLKGVWWSDGEMNLLDMHGIETLSISQNEFINFLNGFLGGAIAGGRYLDKDQSEIELIKSRGRRLIRQGPRIFNIRHHVSLPFMDNAFLEFAMSLPSSLRRGNKIYKKMLLHHFSQYFKDIPYANTGLVIGKELTFWDKIIRKVKVKFGMDRSYHNYDKWLLDESVVNYVNENLINKNSILYEYIEREEVRQVWQKILNGSGNPSQMCKYLTMEIYFKQIFE